MSSSNLMQKHSKEMLHLKINREKEWRNLLKEQEGKYKEADDVSGLAEKFAREREAHNKKFDAEKTDLLDRQQKELEDSKKTKQSRKGDKDKEH